MSDTVDLDLTPQSSKYDDSYDEEAEHLKYMKYALSLAEKSPPKPTNYRVGAVLVNLCQGAERLRVPFHRKIMADGYTLECEGNTHAEQCCFIKFAKRLGLSEDKMTSDVLCENPIAWFSHHIVLYTTMEPCSTRLSGNISCVERILKLKGLIKTVYVGIKEPETFVGENTGRRQLEDAGIKVILVKGPPEEEGLLQAKILEVATAGHSKDPIKSKPAPKSAFAGPDTMAEW